jgi:arylsulfatase A-like enzyme
MDLYEGGIRVPFIAWWKGKIAPGGSCDVPIVQYDLMATFADLVGFPSPETDGVSILKLMQNKPGFQRPAGFLYFEYPENGGQVAVIKGNWKALRRNLVKNPDAPWELYDLEKDASEQRNLADQFPGVVNDMRKIVAAEHRHPVVREWEVIDPIPK